MSDKRRSLPDHFVQSDKSDKLTEQPGSTLSSEQNNELEEETEKQNGQDPYSESVDRRRSRSNSDGNGSLDESDAINVDDKVHIIIGMPVPPFHNSYSGLHSDLIKPL